MGNFWIFCLVFFLLTVREGLRVKPDNDAPVSKALYRLSRGVVRVFRGWLLGSKRNEENASDGL